MCCDECLTRVIILTGQVPVTSRRGYFGTDIPPLQGHGNPSARAARLSRILIRKATRLLSYISMFAPMEPWGEVGYPIPNSFMKAAFCTLCNPYMSSNRLSTWVVLPIFLSPLPGPRGAA